MSMSNFLKYSTNLINEEEAVDDVIKKIKASSSEFSFLFISHLYSIEKIERSLQKYNLKNVIACTTAGEIHNNEFHDQSISGLSFHGEEFICEKVDIDDLDNPDNKNLEKAIKKVRINEEMLGKSSNSFGMLIIDGLSIKEEEYLSFLVRYLEEIPLIGGSAGDGLNFSNTYILSDNLRFKTNCATIVFVTTTIPFKIFKEQHFEIGNKKVVITDSIPEKRIVKEINGEPAALAYARELSLKVEDLKPSVFSKHPLMLKVGEEFYIRSIQQVNSDDSLTFYCAIDTGLVLNLAEKRNIVNHAERFFSKIKEDLGEVECSVLFECILRRIEIEALNESDKVKLLDFYNQNNSIGFHTYGEQYGPIHLNQTLVGVVFGKRK